MTTPDVVSVETLETKTKMNGKILKTTLAGALVDIGQSLPGVLHISQISETPVNKVTPPSPRPACPAIPPT